jgi:DNA-binding NarL/FixJ family response regulator
MSTLSMPNEPGEIDSHLEIAVLGTGILASSLAAALVTGGATLAAGGTGVLTFRQLLARLDDGRAPLDAVVAVIDPDFDDFWALGELSTGHRLAVVAVVVEATQEVSLRLLDAGVSGCMLIDDTPAAILNAVRSARAGGLALHPQAGRWLVNAWNRRPSGDELLSPRGWEILELVAAGLANKQIARRLRISEGTVKAHLTKVFQQIGVDSRAHAAIWLRSYADRRLVYRPAS